MAVATKSVVSDFQEQGFVKVKGVLDPATVLDPIIEEYEGVLDNLARDLYEDGEIASEYRELPFRRAHPEDLSGDWSSARSVLRLLVTVPRRQGGHSLLVRSPRSSTRS